MQITWNSSVGATYYEIYRNTSEISTSATRIGTSTTLSYNDTTVTALTAYYYFIKACNSSGCSGLSVTNSGYRSQSAPTNDNFSTAKLVNTSPYSTTQDTRGATNEGTDPNCVGRASVWYQYTPATGGNLELNTNGSSYDTLLAVFTGAQSNLTQVGCDDDSGDGTDSMINIPVNAGVTLYIAASDCCGQSGSGIPGGTLVFNSNFSPVIEFTSEAPSQTNTPTPSKTPTFTKTPITTVFPTSTLTQKPSRTPTKTITPKPSRTPTKTITPKPSRTPTKLVPSKTPSPVITRTPTKTLTPKPTRTPTVYVPSKTPTPKMSRTPTSTLTPKPSRTPTATIKPTKTKTPVNSPTALATAIPTFTQTATLTASPSATATSSPTASATLTLTVTPTATFTASPTPSILLTPGVWNSIDPMSVNRDGHTSTLLPDGRVLIVGGVDGTTYYSSVEIFDPSTNAWTSATSMSVARAYHSATLLQNGKVLVVGGANSSAGPSLKSVEIYNPTTDTWTTKGSITVGRVFHSATLLKDGRVLVAGGSTDADTWTPSTTTATAEIYDPGTGTWLTTGSMALDRNSHLSIILLDGRVLVAGGGTTVHWTTISTAEIYDPSSGSWSSAGNMGSMRNYPAGTLLENGKVLIAGGFSDSQGTLNTAEIYDPANNTWSFTGSMVTGRGSHTALLLGDNRVLVIGGDDGNWGGNSKTGAEIFNPTTSTWSSIANLMVARFDHEATLLSNGSVLVSGGRNDNSALSSAELYVFP